MARTGVFANSSFRVPFGLVPVLPTGSLDSSAKSSPVRGVIQLPLYSPYTKGVTVGSTIVRPVRHLKTNGTGRLVPEKRGSLLGIHSVAPWILE